MTLRTERAFTLIELVVVLAIMGLFAAIALPRLGSHQRRSFDLAVEQVADLLTMYAQRDALSERPAAIWHDAERNWIVLLAMEPIGTPQDPAQWYPDPFVDPVRLPESIPADGVRARAGGDAVDFARWPITTDPGRERQSVEIELLSRDGLASMLVLPAHAIAPHEPETGRQIAPLDLDAAGRSREDW